MNVKIFPYRYCLKYLIAQITPNNSNSVSECFSSKEFRNLDAYAFATQPASVFCSNAVLSPNEDASETTRVSNF